MYDPAGVEFYDVVGQRHMKYVTEGHHKGWIVYKHPDGQWVTFREATAKDVRAIRDAASQAHHSAEKTEATNPDPAKISPAATIAANAILLKLPDTGLLYQVEMCERIVQDEINGETIRLRAKLAEAQGRLTAIGICPTCGEEIEHCLDEPTAVCGCSGGNMEWTEPPPVLQMLRRELAEAREATDQDHDRFNFLLSGWAHSNAFCHMLDVGCATTIREAIDAARAKEAGDEAAVQTPRP